MRILHSRRRLLLVHLGLYGCQREASGPRQVRRVRLAIFRGEEFTPLAAALGHFKAEGLDAEVNEVASTSKAMQALFGGSADVVTGGFDHAVHLAAEGRRARSFFVLTTRSPLALVASPRAPHIRRVEDLKGATVGISAFGSSGQHFVAHLLARHGLNHQDVRFAVTGGGHSVTVASIEHGQVDAIVTLPASLAILRARVPKLAILADASSVDQSRRIFGVEAYPGVCMMAQAHWLAQNGGTARALGRAMTKTLSWMRTHSAEELQRQLRNRNGAPPEELEGLRATIAAASHDGRMPVGGPEAVRNLLASSYPGIGSLDLASTYTDEFTEPAAAK